MANKKVFKHHLNTKKQNKKDGNMRNNLVLLFNSSLVNVTKEEADDNTILSEFFQTPNPLNNPG
ncbi:hypothetical protein Hanom_Chr17g01542631 [Helianthus anomalus]